MSGGCIEAVISACCTADVISANTDYRRQNQFVADLQEERPAGVTKASTSVIENRIDRQLQKSWLQRSKSGKGKHSRHWIRSISESILGPVPYIGKQDCVKPVLCRQFIEQSKGGECGRCNPLRGEQRQDYDSEIAGIATVVRVKRVSIRRLNVLGVWNDLGDGNQRTHIRQLQNRDRVAETQIQRETLRSEEVIEVIGTMGDGQEHGGRD